MLWKLTETINRTTDVVLNQTLEPLLKNTSRISSKLR